MQQRADFGKVTSSHILARVQGSPQLPVDQVAGGHGRDRGTDIVRYRGCLVLGGRERKAEFAARPGDKFFAFKLLPKDPEDVERERMQEVLMRTNPVLWAQLARLQRSTRRAEADNLVNPDVQKVVMDAPARSPWEVGGKLVLTLLGVDNVGVFTRTADCSGQTCEHHQCFPAEAVERCLSDLLSEPKFRVSYELISSEEYAKEHATFGEADETLIVSSLAKCLGKARDFASFSDIIIRVDGVEFKAHMVVLAAQSEVFRAMFESNMCERSEGVLKLDDTNPEAVGAMLKYMYGRDLTCIKEDLMVAVDLLRLANKYNIEGLQETCDKIIRARNKEDVDMRTALHIFLCGFQLSFPELEEYAARIVKTKHAEILNSGSDLIFNDFLKANVDATRKLLYLVIK